MGGFRVYRVTHCPTYWAAVEEADVKYSNKEPLLSTMCRYYDKLVEVP